MQMEAESQFIQVLENMSIEDVNFLKLTRQLSLMQLGEVIPELAQMNINLKIDELLDDASVFYNRSMNIQSELINIVNATFSEQMSKLSPKFIIFFYGQPHRLNRDLNDDQKKRAIRLFHLVEEISAKDLNALCKWLCHGIKEMSICQCEWKIPEDEEVLRPMLEEAFSVDHMDPHSTVHRLFSKSFNVLRDWEVVKDQRTIYAPCIVIAQCSGSGKSRTISELSRLIPTIYMCYRSSGENGHGFPPATPCLWEYMLHGSAPSGMNADIHCYLRAVSLYFACFEAVNYVYYLNNSDMYHDFYLYQRTDTFWDGLLHRMRDIEERLVSSFGKGTYSWDDFEKKIARKFPSYFQRHLATSNDLLSMVICFDEVSTLAQSKWQRASQSVMTHLLRASRLMDASSRCVVILMDTLCHLPSLTPEGVFKSERLAPAGEKLEFFHDLAYWDLNVEQLDSFNIKEATDEARLCYFGRPLWQATLSYSDPSNVLKLAMAKLEFKKRAAVPVGGTAVAKADEVNLGPIALLCCCTGIPVTPFVQESRQLVSSHMGYLLKLDPSDGNLKMGYPSDPTLAKAARKLWQKQYKMAEKIAALTSLRTLLKRRVLSVGDKCEYLSAFVCLEAMDKSPEQYEDRQIKTAQMWFKQLIEPQVAPSEDPYCKPLLCGPNSSDYVPLTWEEFKNLFVKDKLHPLMDGLIHLTHFVKVNGYTPNRADLLRCFERGAAIICRRGQEGFDLKIPVAMHYKIRNIEKEPKRHTVKKPSLSSERATVSGAKAMGPICDEYHIIDWQAVMPQYEVRGNKPQAENEEEEVSLPDDCDDEDDCDEDCPDSPLKKRKSGTRNTALPFDDESEGETMEREEVLVELEEKTYERPTSSPESINYLDYNIDANNMTYILIQCKFRSKESTDLVYEPVLRDPGFIVEETKHWEKRIRPYAVIGMYFSDGSKYKRTVVRELPIKQYRRKAEDVPKVQNQPVDDHILRFTICNPHWNLGAMGESIQALLESVGMLSNMKDVE